MLNRLHTLIIYEDSINRARLVQQFQLLVVCSPKRHDMRRRRTFDSKPAPT